MSAFTVWCSFSSAGAATSSTRPPKKHFDASYKNLEDANDRARYLFYWNNPWAHPEDMANIVMIKSDNSAYKDCANTFHCVHPNGEQWSVSVVHDSAFKYLDNATEERHSFEDDGSF